MNQLALAAHVERIANPNSPSILVAEQMGSQLSHVSSFILHSLEESGQAIELLSRLVINDNLAAIGISRSDQDGRTQALEKALFKFEKMGGPGVVSVRRVSADSGTCWARYPRDNEGLGLSHGEVLSDHGLAGGKLAVRVREAEERPCVSLSDVGGSHRIQDLTGEIEQADQVGDGRAVDTEPAGQLFLRTAEAGQVLAESTRLVDRVEVLALEVLDHSQLENALVVEDEDPGGHFVKLSFDAGAQPAFAGDELVSLARRPDQDRLKHAVLSQRVSQRGDFLGVEPPAWLERVRVNLIHGDLDQLAAIEQACVETPFFTAQQGFQSASKTSFIHGP